MDFRKYQHIERLGTSATEGILDGRCVIMPKLDGANGSVWLNENGELCAGSRRRKLTLEKDNQGFLSSMLGKLNLLNYLKQCPGRRLYGEWLVPHHLKTYRDTAWRNFYIFDVCIDSDYLEDGVKYIPFEEYVDELQYFGLDYISPIAIKDNPTEEFLERCLNSNYFLIKSDKGIGEGIVIKNYDFVNKYGNKVWAKMVNDEFKARNKKSIENNKNKVKVDNEIEQSIVDNYCTAALINKEYAKIVNAEDGWRSQLIPKLLNTVYHELITEEMWNIVKKYHNPPIDFQILNGLVVHKIKEAKKELF